MKGLIFEVWVLPDAMPGLLIDSLITQFRFYERADLTASGRPLKTDKQITPPFINAAPLWDGKQ